MPHTVAEYVHWIRSLPAPALAGVIEDFTGMLARGEVDEDFGDWAMVAIERLDEIADEIEDKQPGSLWMAR
jgi:hypothetical protein